MGIYAFVAGVVALIVAFLFGRKRGVDTTTTKISGEVTIQRERAEKAEHEAELAKNVSETVVEVAKAQQSVIAEINEAETRLDTAKKQRDVDAAIEIARRLAEIAIKKQGESR